MPDIGFFHPQIVHFVVALLFVGVGARVLAFLPLGDRFRFLNPAAAVLVIMGSVAAVVAAEAGDDAHDAVERIPGVRSAVMEHEDAGDWARDVFIVVGLLEIAGLGLGSRKLGQWARIGGAVVGVVGLGAVYKAADLGGDIVYEYAGGPGIRSGDTTDVRRLLNAGLYNQARQDRQAGRAEDAARLVDELARRNPGDVNVRMVVADSRIRDRKDAKGALAILDSIQVPPDSARLALRVGSSRATAFVMLGKRDSALAVLEALLKAQPNTRGLKARIDSLTASK